MSLQCCIDAQKDNFHNLTYIATAPYMLMLNVNNPVKIYHTLHPANSYVQI